ncbi:MAG TPA: ferrous iron transport protein A [Clostridiales bacterium]|nr:FeoA family protein [Eubacteriales bacterium]HBR31833.1 ferrous iron transport protein A [Clostridiales bacterium]
MSDIKTLNDLKEGQSAKVKELKSFGSIRRRLQDIGLVEGTEVKCLQKSPSGDPVAYLIRGAVIAIRAEDSSNILVI